MDSFPARADMRTEAAAETRTTKKKNTRIDALSGAMKV